MSLQMKGTFTTLQKGHSSCYRLGGVIVSVFASSAGGRWSIPCLGQIKNIINSICCLFAKHASLRNKSKDWSAQIQNNASGLSDMTSCGLLLSLASMIKKPVRRVSLVQSKVHPSSFINMLSS